MKKRVLKLLQRGAELGQAEYQYQSLIYHLRTLLTRLKGSEFTAKIDRRLPDRLERVLEDEIRPEIIAVREEYVRLCGFAWDDWVRIQNPGLPAVQLVPTDMHFRPFPSDPHAWLHGKALKANGRPGNKGVQTRLAFGSSQVTVLVAGGKGI